MQAGYASDTALALLFSEQDASQGSEIRIGLHVFSATSNK